MSLLFVSRDTCRTSDDRWSTRFSQSRFFLSTVAGGVWSVPVSATRVVGSGHRHQGGQFWSPPPGRSVLVTATRAVGSGLRHQGGRFWSPPPGRSVLVVSIDPLGKCRDSPLMWCRYLMYILLYWGHYRRRYPHSKRCIQHCLMAVYKQMVHIIHALI